MSLVGYLRVFPPLFLPNNHANIINIVLSVLYISWKINSYSYSYPSLTRSISSFSYLSLSHMIYPSLSVIYPSLTWSILLFELSIPFLYDPSSCSSLSLSLTRSISSFSYLSLSHMIYPSLSAIYHSLAWSILLFHSSILLLNLFISPFHDQSLSLIYQSLSCI
jgi:hypothetical protein